jgi:hypothetical protein
MFNLWNSIHNKKTVVIVLLHPAIDQLLKAFTCSVYRAVSVLGKKFFVYRNAKTMKDSPDRETSSRIPNNVASDTSQAVIFQRLEIAELLFIF